jgi:hypothetical protein
MPQYDLTSHNGRRALALQLTADIDAWCKKAFDDGHRNHLGASLIGRECLRELWYVFRWVKHVEHDGRMQRLFKRGHFEEPRFASYLRGIGCEVTNSVRQVLHYNPESEAYFYAAEFTTGPDGLCVDVTGNPQHEAIAASRGIKPEQMRVSGVGGHFGGSLDGEVKLPASYGDLPVMVNEYKTQATGHKFAALQKNGVKIEKPDHFAQMCIYGRKRGHKYAVYMAVNKNDDSLYVEVVELDWQYADRLEQKAQTVILSPTPPEKLSQSPLFQKCSYCDFKSVCHEGAQYEKNCRSCQFAAPADGGVWNCTMYGQAIPADFIRIGCDGWTPAR